MRKMFSIICGTLLFGSLSATAAAEAPFVPPPPPIGADHDGLFYVTYPKEELRLRQEGVSKYRMKVARDGLPTDCEVIESSGSKKLDQLTCAAAVHNVRFNPVLDEKGWPLRFTYVGEVAWRVE